MGVRAFGVGWAKTGTTTLGECLRALGFHHVSTRLDLIDDFAQGRMSPLFEVADEHDSFEDWPWLLLYEAMDQRYPRSKFILTLRDDDTWIRSYRNMLEREKPDSDLQRKRVILYGFDVNAASDDQLIARRRSHEDCVRRYFRGREEDLLEVDWSRGDDWTTLAPFLGKPVPSLPFPHANKATYAKDPLVVTGEG